MFKMNLPTTAKASEAQAITVETVQSTAVAVKQQDRVAVGGNPTTTLAEQETKLLDSVYSVIVNGDLSRLDQRQRLDYYNHVCKTLGLNPATKPLEFIKFPSGKMTLYALKETATQLGAMHKVSVKMISLEKLKEESILQCIVEASTPDGRITHEIGAVAFGDKISGEAAANARMKCITKAKRRAVLTHCGLGFTVEDELEGMNVKVVGLQDEVKPKQKPVKKPNAEPLEIVPVEPAQNAATLAADEIEMPTIDLGDGQPLTIKTTQDILDMKERASKQFQETLNKIKEQGNAKNQTNNKGSNENTERNIESTERNESSDSFDFENQDHRQRFIRLCREKFPTINRQQLVALSEKYRKHRTFTDIISGLDNDSIEGFEI